MMKVNLLIGVGLLLVSTSIFANGWECEGKKSTYEVRLYNKVETPDRKSPAVLLITRNGELVAIAKGSRDIEMTTTRSDFSGSTPSDQMKVYTVDAKNLAADGGLLKNIRTIVLKVNGNQDSETLKYGQRRAGRLEIDSAGDVKQSLQCYYYLKGARQED